MATATTSITYLELEETLAIANERACIWPRQQPIEWRAERLLRLERDINQTVRVEWRRFRWEGR